MSKNKRITRRGGSRLTKLYVAALSTVALLSLVAQALVQWQLHNGESDSRVINIAGRQRMLSQRLAKASLRVSFLEENRPKSLRELDETLVLWSRSHHGLQWGDDREGLPGANSPEVCRLFAEIQPYFMAMRSSSRLLLDGHASPSMKQRAAEVIQENEGKFLEGMDAIVSQYVVEAEQKVSQLKSLELGVLLLTIGVLVAEGMFIFRPAVRQIERTLSRLSRTSNRLRRAKLQAEEADAAKTRFLANVSHELRTPMTAVLGMTELARDEGDPAKRDNHLATVAQAGELLLGLLNDLIDYARVDSGMLELVIQPFSPHEVLGRVSRMMRPACEAKKLSLALYAEVAPHLRVRGDARRLEQVLLNLLSNAIKWTSEGVVYVRCQVLEQEDSLITLRFSIQDTGAGISADNHRLIFEPFTQISGDKTTATGGVGLGLAICRRIADAMGAELTLTSSLGVGTTVQLTSDFCICQSANLPTTAPILRGAKPPLSVLVVEDTEVNQLLFREFLLGDGHHVVMAASGEEALEIVGRQAFDVLLVDLQLPGIDGVETAKLLRPLLARHGGNPRMVCVTADARGTLSSEPLLHVFDAVLVKPFNRQQLLSILVGDQGDQTCEATQEPMSSDFARELAEAYLNVAQQQEQELETAGRSNDCESLRVLAHRAASQVAYFESPALVEALRSLEDAARSGDSVSTTSLLPPCLNGLANLRRALSDNARVAGEPPTESSLPC